MDVHYSGTFVFFGSLCVLDFVFYSLKASVVGFTCVFDLASFLKLLHVAPDGNVAACLSLSATICQKTVLFCGSGRAL